VVEALVDEEAVWEDKGLVLVIRLNEAINHLIAAVDVFPGQVLFLVTAFGEVQFGLELGDFLFQPRNNDSRVYPFIPLHVILN